MVYLKLRTMNYFGAVGREAFGLPAHCVCGQDFSVNHAMNCPTGGYPTLQHNECTTLLLRLCLRFALMCVLSLHCSRSLGRLLTMHATANLEDDVRVDVCAAGFWSSCHQKAYFDVKVFNPNAPSYRGSQLSSMYRRFEQDKHRKYEQG